MGVKKVNTQSSFIAAYTMIEHVLFIKEIIEQMDEWKDE